MERAAEQTLDLPPGDAAGRAQTTPAGLSFEEKLTRLRYRYWPDHWVGEILAKRWTETAIPAPSNAVTMARS